MYTGHVTPGYNAATVRKQMRVAACAPTISVTKGFHVPSSSSKVGKFQKSPYKQKFDYEKYNEEDNVRVSFR